MSTELSFRVDDAGMPDIEARPADPRDRRWEVWNPRYRVHFWQQVGDAHLSREFDITATEVDAALSWIATERADDETFMLFALVDSGADRGLVRHGLRVTQPRCGSPFLQLTTDKYGALVQP
jgi:hypothetical protein